MMLKPLQPPKSRCAVLRKFFNVSTSPLRLKKPQTSSRGSRLLVSARQRFAPVGCSPPVGPDGVHHDRVKQVEWMSYRCAQFCHSN